MRRLRNQDLGFAEDIRYVQNLKKKKKTQKSQDWHMKRVVKSCMSVEVGDAHEHLRQAKFEKAEARHELTMKLGKNTTS